MNENSLRYKIDGDLPFARYVFRFIFRALGINAAEVSNDNADIYYGNNDPPNASRIVIMRNESDVVWRELVNGKISSNDIATRFPFDIINAIGYCLRDDGNKNLPADCYDVHDRLKFKESFQYKSNIADLPIVSVYVSFLREVIEGKFAGKVQPLWGEGKKCAIGLSHDVDFPDKYALIKGASFEKGVSFKNKVYVIHNRIKALGKRLFDRDPNGFWLFDKVMDVEEKYGFNSTFFFAPVNRYKTGSSRFDVDYDISRSEFAEVFSQISARGFEIGLHASYNAYQDSNRLMSEKNRLEEYSKVDVKGLRHHYWHLGRDKEKALRAHEEAGFLYDSSIAFNENPGFRRGTAHPWYPWNEASISAIRTIQLPVFCMDASLFRESTNANEAFEMVKKFIEMIKRYGGMGVIDWHVRSSFPGNRDYFVWGEVYLRILEYLAREDDIWVTNLGEIAAWLKGREKSTAPRWNNTVH
ncbi:polysaccharide deacetylase family protein [bacterium]|nr:polysaccharide deacetylase family protein [bacterium]